MPQTTTTQTPSAQGRHKTTIPLIIFYFNLVCFLTLKRDKGAFTYEVSKILANFTPPPLPSPCQQLSALSDPLMTSAFARPPPHFKVTSLSKNPLHSTPIETLNVYLIQLKTERCHQFRGVYKCSSLTHSDRHA